MNFNFDLLNIVLRLPAVLIAITLHEYAHARAATFMGDDTPGLQGRLSLSPLDHIDWIGMACFLILGFGWAKPVQVNPSKFKNKRWGDTIVSAVGPLTNLAIAIVAAPIYMMVLRMPVTPALVIINQIMANVMYLNIIFFFINLLPIPPLDGYHIIRDIFWVKYPKFFIQYEKYGVYIFMVLIITRATNYLVGMPAGFIFNIILGFFRLLGL